MGIYLYTTPIHSPAVAWRSIGFLWILWRCHACQQKTSAMTAFWKRGPPKRSQDWLWHQWWQNSDLPQMLYWHKWVHMWLQPDAKLHVTVYNKHSTPPPSNMCSLPCSSSCLTLHSKGHCAFVRSKCSGTSVQGYSWAQSIEILVFPTPPGYLLRSFGFSLLIRDRFRRCFWNDW